MPSGFWGFRVPLRDPRTGIYEGIGAAKGFRIVGCSKGFSVECVGLGAEGCGVRI